jgi:hypothetical protein
VNRDQRLLLVASGEASLLESFVAQLEVTCSARARSRYRQFVAVGKLMHTALAEQDDQVTVNIRNRRTGPKAGSSGSLLLLGLLVAILVVEWNNYTLPAVSESLRYLAHQCGIK